MFGQQIVDLHHRLADVQQLLQLQLLALVRQLAQRARLLQIAAQLHHALHDLLVRLRLLPQTVVFVLHVSSVPHSHLPSRTEHQVRVRVVHVRQRPVATQQRLPQLLPLLLPVLQDVFAHLVGVHAVELQLLDEERLQDVLRVIGRIRSYGRRLRVVLAAVLLRAVDHPLEQVEGDALGFGGGVAVQFVLAQPHLRIAPLRLAHFVIGVEIILDTIRLLLQRQRNVLDEAVGSLEGVGDFRVIVGNGANRRLRDGDARLGQKRRFLGRLRNG